MIEFDDLKKILSRYVEISNEEKEGEFNRNILITIPTGKEFKIEWWSNMGYFYLCLSENDNSFIMFDELSFSNSWPMIGGNLMSIRLKYQDVDVAVLPIEKVLSKETK